MNAHNDIIPKYGLKLKLNHVYPEKRTQNVRYPLKQIWPMLPLALRYLWYYVKTYFQGRKTIMDYLFMETGKQIYGVPIGGIGGGTIGRGYRGEFCRFQLRPGMYEYNTVAADQFIVNIQGPDKETIFQSVLSTYSKPAGPLSCWQWLIDGSKCNYTGLYPRAWTEYNLSDYGIKLICTQISPVIPNNYKDSSFPCAVFVWKVMNMCQEQRTVSITFTFKNGTGTKQQDVKGEPVSSFFNTTSATGVSIHQNIDNMMCSYNLAVSNQASAVRVSACKQIDPNGSGRNIWETIKKTGQLAEDSCDQELNGTDVAVAVCGQVCLEAGASQDLEYSLAWDMPSVKFLKRRARKRFYTKYFSDDCSSGPSICDYGLANYKIWQDSIEVWQKPILDDKKLPDWYKGALFNELYYISDGGTIWLLNNKLELPSNDPRLIYGHFAYLEGHEYRMYNTYDVHFYASHALAMLWPNLQVALQYDFRDSIEFQIVEKRKCLYDGKYVERKSKNSIPHDLGDPDEEPFDLINAYNIHDVSEWRDLNVKFILQVYRDYKLLVNNSPTKLEGDSMEWSFLKGSDDNQDIDPLMFLGDMYERCVHLIVKCEEWDTDGDGLIENNNCPDQTYDAWVMSGPSAYCAGLWLAALQCMLDMAKTLNRTEDYQKYWKIFTLGKKSYDDKLWNGKYYKFDTSEKDRNSIMSDQLCGHWYLRSVGFGYEVFPEHKVKSALQTIFTHNVLAFCSGKMGAVNGFIPVDKPPATNKELDLTAGNKDTRVPDKSSSVIDLSLVGDAGNINKSTQKGIEWIPGHGRVDDIAIQSAEVWTGVTYGLAASMIYEGMYKEGFQTAGGMYQSISLQMGMTFETPEALYAEKCYRAIGYMRPLSIWSMQAAWENSKKHELPS